MAEYRWDSANEQSRREDDACLPEAGSHGEVNDPAEHVCQGELKVTWQRVGRQTFAGGHGGFSALPTALSWAN
jgi:hypothetical protein